MRRDLDLIRELLFYFEAKPDDRMEECPPLEGYSELEIKYHLLLMDEAGLFAANAKSRRVQTASLRSTRLRSPGKVMSFLKLRKTRPLGTEQRAFAWTRLDRCPLRYLRLC